jgi:hypothetical protein
MPVEADALDSEDQDQESSDLYNLANSILAECKTEASLADLESAIYLFREGRPIPHPFRSDSLNDLAAALVTGFAQTNQRQDLDEAIIPRGEVVGQWNGVLVGTAGSQESVSIRRTYLTRFGRLKLEFTT